MKRAYIITGAESTGSVFISKCISTSMGFYSWTGYGFYEPSDDIKFLHRSQPRGSPLQYSDYTELSKIFSGYDCKYIICTRDISFSNLSKNKRFKRTDPQLQHNQNTCKSIISDIVKSGEEYFIWNYETMVYLGDVYFDLLYDFLEIDNNNRKYPEVINGNKIKNAKDIKYFGYKFGE